MAMDSRELDRIHRRATDRLASQQQQVKTNYGEGTGATPSTPAGAFTPGTGLRRVQNNWLPPSASHRPMVFEPTEAAADVLFVAQFLPERLWSVQP